MNLREILEPSKTIFIKQVKEWGEILFDIETVNKFNVLDQLGNKVGFLAEHGGGFFGLILRQVLRTHRPLKISLYSLNQEVIMKVTRPFYFFFSDLIIEDGESRELGTVKRRFGIIYKKYDLIDHDGYTFLQVKAPIWNLWTFPIYDLSRERVGLISKKWGGILKEYFSDADQFGVMMPEVTWEKKAIIFGCAISIDLDYFEDNQRG